MAAVGWRTGLLSAAACTESHTMTLCRMDPIQVNSVYLMRLAMVSVCNKNSHLERRLTWNCVRSRTSARNMSLTG